jgi:hypothetical protein
MRNAFQVLKEKELELERISREVEALRLVAPLLVDEAERCTRMSAQVVEASLRCEPITQQSLARWWRRT